MNKPKQRQAKVTFNRATQEQAKIGYKNRKEKLTSNINKKKFKAGSAKHTNSLAHLSCKANKENEETDEILALIILILE